MSSYPPNPRTGIPTTVTVSPASATLDFGGTVQLTAVLTDAYGSTVSPTESFSWSSSNTSLVTVNNSGLCTATSGNPDILQTGGQVTIAVSYPWASNSGSATISAYSVVTVDPPPAESETLWLATQNLGGSTTTVPTRTAKVYPSSLFEE